MDVIDDVIIDTACVGTSVYMYICLNEVRMYVHILGMCNNVLLHVCYGVTLGIPLHPGHHHAGVLPTPDGDALACHTSCYHRNQW